MASIVIEFVIWLIGEVWLVSFWLTLGAFFSLSSEGFSDSSLFFLANPFIHSNCFIQIQFHTAPFTHFFSPLRCCWCWWGPVLPGRRWVLRDLRQHGQDCHCRCSWWHLPTQGLLLVPHCWPLVSFHCSADYPGLQHHSQPCASCRVGHKAQVHLQRLHQGSRLLKAYRYACTITQLPNSPCLLIETPLVFHVFTLVVSGDEVEVIGGSDTYMAVCRHCYHLHHDAQYACPFLGSFEPWPPLTLKWKGDEEGDFHHWT